MPRLQKNPTLYPHPFSKAYWRDAALELKDVRVLVFTALMIALRVAMKNIRIPVFPPNVYINTAFFINALSAMVFGPVVAILSAVITDTLGCILVPSGPYFFPFILTEVGGGLIFALFLYRVKLTPTRVILSRFCINLFINILLNAPLMYLYYQMVMGKSYVMFQIPQIAKNLFMFPIESVLLTIFLSILAPVLYRNGMIYDKGEGLKIRGKQIALLVVLFAIGVASVVGYLYYYYSTNSISKDFTDEERYTVNCTMTDHVDDRTDLWQDENTVCIVESAHKKFFEGETTYNVLVYTLDKEALDAKIAQAQAEDPDSTYGLAEIHGYSKTPASKDDVLTLVGKATIVCKDKTGQVLSFAVSEVEPAE